VLDFIDMKSRRDQQSVYQRMKTVFAGQSQDACSADLTIGLMEMTRQRHSESVHAAVYDDCPYCKGRER